MGRKLDSQLGRYINVATLVSLIASVLVIYFFVGALNRNAAQTDRQLLTAGIQTSIHHNETWVADYGWWSVARDRLEAGDVDVLSDSMASSFSDHLGFDFVVMSRANDVRTYSWHRDSGQTPLDSLLGPNDIAALRSDLAHAYARGDYIGTHMLTIGDRPYLASVTIVGEYTDRVSETDPATGPILVIGTALDDHFLREMETRFLVNDLSLLPMLGQPHDSVMPIADDDGHAVTQLSWSPSRPGIDTLRFTFLPLLAYIAVFFVGAQVLAYRARKLGRSAQDNERRALKAATTDTLSDLPNRLGFNRFIESPAARDAAAKGEAAVIYIDLNGFKAVNDRAGHGAGDAVIRIVARKFQAALPDGTHIARVGGDEFACALTGQASASQALAIARALSDSLRKPLEIEGRTFEIGAAIGVAWSHPVAVKTFAQLVHDADVAMYRAKADQLEQPLCFDASLGLETDARRALEADIETGLEREEFRVVYQPIVDAQTGRTVSVEALLRWEHPTRGAVPPDVFVSVAEGSRLIRRLGDFVVDSVCRDIGPNADFSVSINLSPTQLGDPDLCTRYLEKLGRAGMSASRIELELTEAVLIDDFDRAKLRLHEFHAAGFRVNLDDFGTGFASMGYLHMLPFSKIKVDKSFVAAIGHGDGPNKMLQALALLGDALDLDMVAEGVETESQAAMLRLLGFEYLQGWHFGMPMTPRALHDRMRGAA
jgi:diguanylate cyclase (GGDEF)-like protein